MIFLARYAYFFEVFVLLVLPVTGFSQEFKWAQGADSIKIDVARVAVDNSGNIYAVGSFSSPAKIGVVTISPVGGIDYCLVKYDSSGNVLWVVNGGGPGRDAGVDVNVDSLGNVYVTGIFHSTIDFEGTQLINIDSNGLSAKAMFIVKYNAEGFVQWARQNYGYADVAHANGCPRVTSMAVSRDRETYITGIFDSTLIFGSATLTALPGTTQAFLAKIDAAGNFIWAKASAGTGVARASSVCVDNLRNVCITGSIQGTNSFGSITLNSAAGDFYITKYDSSGAVLWSEKGGNTGGSIFITTNKIAVNTSMNIFITGNYYGTAIIDSITLPNNGSENFLLAEYNADGRALWAQTQGGTGSCNGEDMAVDVQNHIYVSGSFVSTVALGILAPLTSNIVDDDIFIAKFNETGEALWMVAGGNNSDDYGMSIAANKGIICNTGAYSQNLTLGSLTVDNPLTANTSYLARLADTSNTTAVENLYTIREVKIYPNPCDDEIYVRIAGAGNEKDLVYTLCNVLGEKMLTGILPVSGIIKIDKSVPNGAYFLEVQNKDQTCFSEVLVQH